MTLDANDFRGTARFQLVRRLGSGGMGVVYEVRDRDRDEVVALKTLRWTDPSAIYRFKREFRTLADIAHRNLVTLYELFGERDHWYFTMELVRGGEFLEYVRPGGLDVPRLRATLLQIAEGLVAIHAAGKLHRDLKPSNVRVTPEGRVVILDFGISVDAIRGYDRHATREEGVWGTAEYMAPEQGDGEATPASDWYALGCTLYEALTGRLPHRGPPLKILMDKRVEDPEPPDRVTPGVPRDLAELCMSLLVRAPDSRPEGTEILRRLGSAGPARPTGSRAVPPAAESLVDRVSELAELEQALAAARGGEAVTVLVHGSSGVGKSALVRRFLDRVARDASAVVLSGRCHVRESMPYKGLDGVVDSLTRYLRALPQAELDRLISPDLRTALQLFPVLGRVEQIWQIAPPEDEPSDPIELRRRRFAALRELFRRIAASELLVIYIDDFQWGDSDSLALIDFLLAPPDPPPVLLIVSFTSEDLESHAFLGALLARTGTPLCRGLRVDRLGEQETRRLAHQLLGPKLPATGADLDAIVRESGGNPFLVEQLVQYGATERADAPAGGARGVAGGVGLGQMLDVRLAQLPTGARAFLEALALAARPIDAVVARDVAGLSGDERPLVALLQAERWLRPTSSAERLELYHDRIRRTLTAQIDRTRLPDLHLRLANAIEARRGDDPETLYEHYLEAGQPDRARACATRAGDKAARALAFERAALLYRRAIELTPETSPEIGQLRARLGEALANAGRVRDAAEAYAGAAAVARASDALELRRLAAEQLLIGGRVEEGLAMLGSVLRAAGLKLARTLRQALLWLLLRRLRLRLRGLRVELRDPADIPPEELARIDVCRTVAEGLAHLDTIRAADFQTLHLLLSLKAGEPDRIARALALEAALASLGGGPGRRRAERSLAQATALATRIGSKHAGGLCSVITGLTAYFQGEFQRCRDAMIQAERLLLEHGVGVAWELVTARLYLTLSLFYLGEVDELCRCAAAYLADAAERGNRFAGMMFRTGPTNVTWLVADDVAAARRALSDALAEWPERPFGAPHYMAMTAEARINLYAGDPVQAWRRVTQAWPEFERTRLQRIQSVRIAAGHMRGCCAIAASRALPEERRSLLAAAERDARRTEREGAQWGMPLAALLRAGVAIARPDAAAAARHLREALTGFERGQMQLFSAATRRRLGELVGGDEGRELVVQASAWMTARRIKDPDRMTAMLVPGF